MDFLSYQFIWSRLKADSFIKLIKIKLMLSLFKKSKI